MGDRADEYYTRRDRGKMSRERSEYTTRRLERDDGSFRRDDFWPYCGRGNTSENRRRDEEYSDIERGDRRGRLNRYREMIPPMKRNRSDRIYNNDGSAAAYLGHDNREAVFELCGIIARNGGKMELSKATSQLSSSSKRMFCDVGGLKFVSSFPDLFKIKREGKAKVMVQATLPIRFCDEAKHDLPGCRNSLCMQLHLCPHFVKDKCTYGNKCRRSHKISDQHTLRILDRFHLTYVDPQSLLEILRKIVDETESERTAPVLTIPDICKFYNNEGGCSKGDSCPFLHVCKHFVEDDCKFGRECKRSHNFKNTEHNISVLEKYGLADLSEGGIFGRLQFREPTRRDNYKSVTASSAIKSDIRKKTPKNEVVFKLQQFIPEICTFYNNASNCSREGCRYLHVCKHFVDGNCKFGSRCKREHRFGGNSHNSEVLENCSMAHLSEKSILQLIQSREPNRSSFTSSITDLITTTSQSTAKTSTTREPEDEICGFHLKGKCNYGDRCMKKHTDLPYLWQYKSSQLQSQNWHDFQSDVNVKIEESYSNPKNTDCSVKIDDEKFNITFTNCGNMNAKSRSAGVLDDRTVAIRRLSTASSVVAPPGHIFSTSWLWYWFNEFGKWQSYDTASDGHPTSDTSSQVFEKVFLSGEEKHKFTTTKHSYTMSFKKWYQKNEESKTKRNVRRRPRLVTKEIIKSITQGARPPQSRTDSQMSDVPSHWTPVPLGSDYNLVQLMNTSDEYKKTEARFFETMTGHRIIKIQRVQNIDLWMDFIQKKNKLTKKAGNPPEERQLFHGTSSEIVEAICQQGFDWRVCGKHGTVYGKGSYFAKTASYSHGYTKNSSQQKQMFLSRVIVGSFVTGNSSMVKPPPKDPSQPYGELYDSCVDSTHNPTIFVIFENGQSYPEFLITYL